MYIFSISLIYSFPCCENYPKLSLFFKPQLSLINSSALVLIHRSSISFYWGIPRVKPLVFSFLINIADSCNWVVNFYLMLQCIYSQSYRRSSSRSQSTNRFPRGSMNHRTWTRRQFDVCTG